jgi:hypothetical protein
VDSNSATLDLLKGSYYANPVVDNVTVSPAQRDAYPEYYGENICACLPLEFTKSKDSNILSGPNKGENGVDGFEDAFKDLGR